MSIKEYRLRAGLSRAEMSRMFEIPVRTLENWEAGVSAPPHWAEKLIVEKLESMVKEEKTMTRYELKKNSREIRYTDRLEIKPGCTTEQDDQDPELIASFESKDKALDEMKKYKSSVSKSGRLFEVVEYYVEENQYGEGGEFVSGGDIWNFSAMEISVANESYDVIATFSNMADAEVFYNRYDGDDEISIVFD